MGLCYCCLVHVNGKHQGHMFSGWEAVLTRTKFPCGLFGSFCSFCSPAFATLLTIACSHFCCEWRKIPDTNHNGFAVYVLILFRNRWAAMVICCSFSSQENRKDCCFFTRAANARESQALENSFQRGSPTTNALDGRKISFSAQTAYLQN